MKFQYRILAIFSLWLTFFPAKPYLQNSAIPFASEGFILADCEDVIAGITGDQGWYEQLINPILKTPEEVSDKITYYSEIYACLKEPLQPLSNELSRIKNLIEYFLIFSGGLQEPENQPSPVLTDLTLSDDPAIQQIRDEASIPPPEGVIFVRTYSSRDEMPPLVQRAFENQDVAGVTILNRYVAILKEEKPTWPQQALQNQTLPKTLSHELVHAYLNASPGSQAIDAPAWYHEGIAIYFSGSGEGHSIVTPDLTVSTTPPREYQQFDLNFKFLEAKLGRGGLLEKIRQSVEQSDPSVLYRDLGIASEQELVAQANAWQLRRVILGSGIFLGVVLLTAWILIKRMPEVRCLNCDYTGKKKEFASGVCPNCQRPYNIEVDW